MKSSGIPSEDGRQSKISLKENGVVSIDSKKNTYIFCSFLANVADSLLQKLPRPTAEEHCKQIWNKCEDFVLHNVEVASVEKILKNLDVAQANIINVSIKLDAFPFLCLKKEVRMKLKIIGLFLCYL